jgi:hypothetical protein
MGQKTGATGLGIMTLIITTFSIIAVNIITLSIITNKPLHSV